MRYEKQEAPENYADMEDKVFTLTNAGKAQEMKVPDDDGDPVDEEDARC